MNVQSLLAFEQPGITIFGVKIYAYALIIVFGMAAAFVVISLLFKRRNMSTDLFMTYFCICLPVAIITTRLFYCITDGMPISEWFSLKSIRLHLGRKVRNMKITVEKNQLKQVR